MKNIFLLNLFLLGCCFVYGQDTVKRSNELSTQIHEQYSVLKSNKKLRQGEYYAVYMQKMILAKGRYEAGKRVGEWQYFTSAGKLIQTFDYDKYAFKYLDTSGRKTVQYHFPQTITAADSVSNPIVIGGYYYTIMPLMYQQRLFENLHSDFDQGGKITLKHVLTISPEGVMLKHEVYATADGRSKVYTLDDKDFDDGNKKFIPGMINHQPVTCEITVLNTTISTVRTMTTTGTTTTRSTRIGL